MFNYIRIFNRNLYDIRLLLQKRKKERIISIIQKILFISRFNETGNL